MHKFMKVLLSVHLVMFSFATFAAENALNLKDIEFQREPVVQSGDVYKIIIVLILMLILATAILFVLKKKLGIKESRFEDSAKDPSIVIIDNKRIAPHATVTLLEVGSDRVLVALNKENIAMTNLGKISEHKEPIATILGDDMDIDSSTDAKENN
ncbi:MAG: hypothetical protein D6B28_00230 [Gammaproteobacteria bacterium]|nr:MAG: hypothetical protein D6B28_00230 [Gammaproteobacteria bacterium]